VRRGQRLLGFALAVLAAGLTVDDAGAQVVQQTLSPAQMFELADARRDAAAIGDAIAIYDALGQDPDPEIRTEARYRKGLMLADLGRFIEAATAFRDLLAERPDVLAARLELARVLAAAGREAEARRELRQARAIGIPEDAATVVEQFATVLRSRRPYGISVEFGLAPDSNINRATEARTLDTIIAPLTLSPDARAQSGLGLRTAAQAFVRLPLATDLNLTPRLGLVASTFEDSQFNDGSASALVGLEWTRPTDRMSVSIGQTYRRFGGELYARTDTVVVEAMRPLGPRSQAIIAFSAARASYEANPLQDGELYDLSVAYERALDPRSGLSVAASVTRQAATDPGYATWAAGATVGVWRQTRWGEVSGSLGLRRTEGDARLFLFPEARREWLASARVGATFRSLRFAGFTPTVRLIAEDNASTVGIYDYQRLAAEFGVSRSF
jgi:tetratricopeptide (TPR) repeat protein